MDLAIRFPALGQIHLESRFLFSEPQDPNCRQFLERVFQAQEITQVTIKSAEGTIEAPRAELGFCPKTYTLKQVVERVTQLLNPRAAWPGGSGRHCNESLNGSNGHRQNRGCETCTEPATRNGDGRPAPGSTLEPAGVTITAVTPVRDRKGEIRYFRYGTVVTHWEIKHELAGRLRLKNPVLYRKKDLCQAIERELIGVLGIDSFTTNALTSTVLVHFDRRQLSPAQLIEILESALASAEHPTSKDKMDLHLPLCTASMPLAAVAQFGTPAFLPAAALLFAYTSIPTFKNAREVLFEEKRLGVD
ncbi:MAG TPA: hypothetical protein VHS97_14490, partial [Isosphaeraceae bacterium]|nr:hypothetical protein [Isosphaeraceae bacterium]